MAKLLGLGDSMGSTEEAQRKILHEYIRARTYFDKFNTAHEGYAVILEELDELWELIKTKGTTKVQLEEEAIQVGAMALRFLIDCC